MTTDEKNTKQLTPWEQWEQSQRMNPKHFSLEKKKTESKRPGGFRIGCNLPTVALIAVINASVLLWPRYTAQRACLEGAIDPDSVRCIVALNQNLAGVFWASFFTWFVIGFAVWLLVAVVARIFRAGRRDRLESQND